MKRLVENGLKGGCVVAGLETDDEIRVSGEGQWTQELRQGRRA